MQAVARLQKRLKSTIRPSRKIRVFRAGTELIAQRFASIGVISFKGFVLYRRFIILSHNEPPSRPRQR